MAYFAEVALVTEGTVDEAGARLPLLTEADAEAEPDALEAPGAVAEPELEEREFLPTQEVSTVGVQG